MNLIVSKDLKDLNALKTFATHWSAHHIREQEIILLEGQLGAGKTTFCRYLMKALGFNEVVTSPTYAIYNEYLLSGGSGKKVYHIDLYRLESIVDLESFGFWDILEEPAILLIEWSNKIKNSTWPTSRKITKMYFEVFPHRITVYQN